jgi:hypothetical protein
VATTTGTEQMERTAETTVRTAQQGTNITLDYTVKAQEINAEILRKTAEVWIEGFRKQTELTQQMAEEVFKTSGDEGQAPENFFRQWGFPFWWAPHDPFTFWREWTQAVQKTALDTQRSIIEQTSNVNRNKRS